MERQETIAKNWRQLIRPRELETDTSGADLRALHLRAARARLRPDARQRAAPRAAVVAAGRGDHVGEDRRRAARVLDDPGRDGGRHRHRPEPQGGAAAPARRGPEDPARAQEGRGRAARARPVRRSDRRGDEPRPQDRHALGRRRRRDGGHGRHRQGLRGRGEEQDRGDADRHDPDRLDLLAGAQGQLQRHARARRTRDRLRPARRSRSGPTARSRPSTRSPSPRRS